MLSRSDEWMEWYGNGNGFTPVNKICNLDSRDCCRLFCMHVKHTDDIEIMRNDILSVWFVCAICHLNWGNLFRSPGSDAPLWYGKGTLICFAGCTLRALSLSYPLALPYRRVCSFASRARHIYIYLLFIHFCGHWSMATLHFNMNITHYEIP